MPLRHSSMLMLIYSLGSSCVINIVLLSPREHSLYWCKDWSLFSLIPGKSASSISLFQFPVCEPFLYIITAICVWIFSIFFLEWIGLSTRVFTYSSIDSLIKQSWEGQRYCNGVLLNIFGKKIVNIYWQVNCICWKNTIWKNFNHLCHHLHHSWKVAVQIWMHDTSQHCSDAHSPT